MRSAGRSKTQKKPYKPQRINKKNYKNRLKGSWAWNDDLSGLFLDDINEVLRANKSRRAEGRGSWKVMPKDSCEVYKNRQKRLVSNRRRYEETEDATNDTESEMEDDSKEKKKPPRKIEKKKTRPKKPGPKSKYKNRSQSSSQSSYTNSSTSLSTYSYSYTDASEMDYDDY